MPTQPRSRPRPSSSLLQDPEPTSQDPTQSQSPRESPSGPEGSSPSSPAASSAADDFLADPGPAFDPKHAPAAPTIEAEETGPGVVEFWEEDRIKQLLTVEGNALHYLLRVGPDDTETWKYTEDDLASIAPPLTNILNRYDVTRAAAAAGDEIALAAALTTYGTRNYVKRRRLLQALADAEPRPVTGVPAEPDTGPEDDEDWMRTQPPPALVPKGHR